MACMLYGDMKESRSDVIEFPTADEEVFPLLLKFMYTGTVPIPDNLRTVIKLSQLCDFFNIRSLKQKCGQWIRQNINETTVCACLDFLPVLDESVHSQCMKLITDKTDSVLKSDSFKGLSTSSLQLILNCNTLKVDEMDIFEALQRWVVFQRLSGNNEVQESLPSLIQQIRLPLMTPQQLLGPVKGSGMFSLEAITDALTHIHLPGIGTFRNSPRKIQRRRKTHDVSFVHSPGFIVNDSHAYVDIDHESRKANQLWFRGSHGHALLLRTNCSLSCGSTGVWVEMGDGAFPISELLTFQLEQKGFRKPHKLSSYRSQLPGVTLPIAINLKSGDNSYIVQNASSDKGACVELKLPEKRGFILTVNVKDDPCSGKRKVNCQINDQFIVEDFTITTSDNLHFSIAVSSANCQVSFQLV
jgi:hypothetical protein